CLPVSAWRRSIGSGRSSESTRERGMAERDFEELLRSFNRHKVRYCIVGAFAVAFHVRPRYTKDMDILVEPSLENGRKIVAALKDFGFGVLKVTAEDFVRTGRFIQLGYEPVRIDLLTSIEGCSFEEVWAHRIQGRYGRQRVWFIGQKELIRNKARSGRPQDEVDIKTLWPKRLPRARRRS
ncbi:MAG: hypothetical protein MN733_31370, partial [Nitrososphaera sp.]|nr:hypothetical protein [Nitrososphaera sp.]